MDIRYRPFEDFSYDADGLMRCAIKAGDAIMKYYRKSNISEIGIDRKDDNSLVCHADKAAHEIINLYLTKTFPDIPILSEEDPDILETRKKIDPDGKYFTIDPLDGTGIFIEGGKDFAVNIALVDQGFPRFGVIYAPAHNEIWFGDVFEKKYYYQHLITKQTRSIEELVPNKQVVLGVPSSQKRDDKLCLWLGEKLSTAPMLPIGASLKFARLASGRVDIYPRFKPSMIWDAAAGQAIVEARGGVVVSLSQITLKDLKYESPLTYYPMRLTNPHFAAFSKMALEGLGMKW